MLRNVARLPCLFKHAALISDAHLGIGSMVGSVKEAVIPATVGVDIGCGMMAVKTPFKSGIYFEKRWERHSRHPTPCLPNSKTGRDKAAVLHEKLMEPPVGFEPTTFRLRIVAESARAITRGHNSRDKGSLVAII